MLLVFDNFWTFLMRKCSCWRSCHGKITCSLTASTLPPHFTYAVEGCLFLSECSAPSTPWLQPQLSFLAMPQHMCSSSSDTFSLGGVSGRAVFVIQGGVVLWEVLEGQCCALVVHEMPLPCTTPSQLGAAAGALGSLC